jgi:hypothetical protein
MKMNRKGRRAEKFRGYSPVRAAGGEGEKTKVGVEKGYGPRHAANAKEGEDLTAINTDTVPAMLTPREAVLNRNASELAGRGNIEALNKEGNLLAKKGVDLAAGGDSDVEGFRKSIGMTTDEEDLRNHINMYMQMKGTKDPEVLAEMFGDPSSASAQAKLEAASKLVGADLSGYGTHAKGSSNIMKNKNSKQSKPKQPGSGSPYVAGFEKAQGLQGGGYADGMPGYNPRDFPHPMAGKMHEGMSGLGGGAVLGQPGGTLGQPGGWKPIGGMTGGPEPVQQNRDFAHPRAGLMLPGGSLGGGPVLGQPGGTLGQPGGWKPVGAGGGMTPYGGGGSYGEPPGSYGANMKGYAGGMGNYPGQKTIYGQQAPSLPPGQNWGGGGFYPPGQGLNKGYGFAEGTSAVPGGIGSANSQTAYDPRAQVDFKAPDISGFIKALHDEAKKQGISQSQMGDIVKQFSGLGNYGGSPGGGDMPYDQLGGQYASFTGGTPGYQGGISEIGYPPFLMPNAEYHADKGSTWEGPYDPQYLVQRYARGENDVPSWADPGDLGINTGPGGFGRPSTIGEGGGGHSGYNNRSSWQGGAPGFPWSPTMIQTTYNPQGYPYAVPVQGPDQNLQGVGRTHNLRHNQ